MHSGTRLVRTVTTRNRPIRCGDSERSAGSEARRIIDDQESRATMHRFSTKQCGLAIATDVPAEEEGSVAHLPAAGWQRTKGAPQYQSN